MPHLNEHCATWIGRTLTDASGQKIGRIDDVYTDDDTRQPEWLAVTAGLMGPITYFVPVRAANLSGHGVQVSFPKDRVKVAPSAGADGRLSRMEKGRLYAHYGYSYAEERNRLQRSLGFDPPGPSRPPDGRDERPAVDLRELGPGPTPAVSRPVERHDEAASAPMPEVSSPAERRDRAASAPAPEVSSPAERRDRAVPAPTPVVSYQAERRDVALAAPPPKVSYPVDGRDEAAPPPPASRGEDRGRWPDDDAIFALSQAAAGPLATSGAPRRR